MEVDAVATAGPEPGLAGTGFHHPVEYDRDGAVIAASGERGDFRISPTQCFATAPSGADAREFSVYGTYQNGDKKALCYDGHPGWDYAANPLDVVRAAADGVVLFRGCVCDGGVFVQDLCVTGCSSGGSSTSLGNFVALEHANGYVTYYGHLYSFGLFGVGSPVLAGDVIGLVGDTGATGGTHLHFEVAEPGETAVVDPYGFHGDDVLWVEPLPAAPVRVQMTLRSGNKGSDPSAVLDCSVTRLRGPTESPFSAPFTPSHFTAASSQASASILGALHPLWKQSLDQDVDEHALWIGDGASATALYAVDFWLPESSIDHVTLDLDFLVDNQLGDTFNEGVFINGQAVVGSKRLGNVLAHFQQDQAFPTFDVSGLVVPGTNTLYINGADLGVAAGLLFSARITAGPPSIPVVPARGALAIGFLFLCLVAVGRRASQHARQRS